MYTIDLETCRVYLDEAYAEGNGAIAGAVFLMPTKPYRYAPVAETWMVSKGTLDHVWASRERAHALIRAASRLVEEGALTEEEAAELVRQVDWGWNCPEHPLIPLSGPYDVCMACVEEA